MNWDDMVLIKTTFFYRHSFHYLVLDGKTRKGSASQRDSGGSASLIKGRRYVPLRNTG